MLPPREIGIWLRRRRSAFDEFEIREPCKTKGFPCSSVSKESVCNSGDPSLIPGLGRSPGERHDDPLQYPCLENLMDRGA